MHNPVVGITALTLAILLLAAYIAAIRHPWADRATHPKTSPQHQDTTNQPTPEESADTDTPKHTNTQTNTNTERVGARVLVNSRQDVEVSDLGWPVYPRRLRSELGCDEGEWR